MLTAVVIGPRFPLLSIRLTFAVLRASALRQTPLWLHGADELTLFFQRANPLSRSLLSLTILIMFLSGLARLGQLHNSSGHVYFSIILLLFVFVSLAFTVNKTILFYLFFEASLIPIFLIVMGWGYQPERLRAGFALFFYTLVTSLPLLLVILNLGSNLATRRMDRVNLRRLPALSHSFASRCLQLFTLSAFLVKLPIFMVHQWLPKAHVEAPVAGSIILAAVLLKLGGYGLCRFASVFSQIRPLYSFLLSIVLIGGGIVGLLCVRQTDIKVLIAYSSVSHISFVAAGFILNSWWAFVGAFLMMIAHGICSSGIFAGANVIYLRTNRRLLSLNKGVLGWLPFFTLVWFLLSLGNMGAPPTINLVREIISIVGILNFSRIICIPVSIITFFAAAYTLVLYRGTQHGETPASVTRGLNLLPAERLMLTGHVYWLLLLVLSLTIFIYTYITNKFFHCCTSKGCCCWVGICALGQVIHWPK